ncbi:zinc finger CCCH domain-containing protein 35-like [Curcuma longa]|uniref:zinc finger CCCH domain-containing protein 35-like n=1 Tax=Curcuma longa TaxID=136217 RepID=UPI003D9E3907
MKTMLERGHLLPLCGFEDPTAGDGLEDAAVAALLAVEIYASDEFRMFEFKVRRCVRGRSHDWTECPFAHPGEKARRRDPRKHRYSGAACPDFRKAGGCKRGDACELAHGVFECWLHPDRYRTQTCKDGVGCRRRVCFFAHTADQLRPVPLQRQQSPSSDSHFLQSYLSKYLVSSPTSTMTSPPTSPSTDSPPISPVGAKLRRASWHGASSASLTQSQLGRANSAPGSWALQVERAMTSSPFKGISWYNSGLFSLPSTPTATSATGGDAGLSEEDWPAERVESGRELREKMFERLSKGLIFKKA